MRNNARRATTTTVQAATLALVAACGPAAPMAVYANSEADVAGCEHLGQVRTQSLGGIAWRETRKNDLRKDALAKGGTHVLWDGNELEGNSTGVVHGKLYKCGTATAKKQ